ncbi:hypothetical protein HMPREF9997_02260 [Corynebacterium durum F0235]|uniref:Uncharacterized protein n=1 Tax=Corynebacterium durum F0235 TaxID=1035195 RepID=L1MCA5_9CORY|nr:hypothetical protein HMPREF9997_02260 [Corynebacterium durum F0235]
MRSSPHNKRCSCNKRGYRREHTAACLPGVTQAFLALIVVIVVTHRDAPFFTIPFTPMRYRNWLRKQPPR